MARAGVSRFARARAGRAAGNGGRGTETTAVLYVFCTATLANAPADANDGFPTRFGENLMKIGRL